MSVKTRRKNTYEKTNLLFWSVRFAFSFPAEVQQTGKVPRIGYLSTGSSAPPLCAQEDCRQGLRDLGYIEGEKHRASGPHGQFLADLLNGPN